MNDTGHDAVGSAARSALSTARVRTGAIRRSRLRLLPERPLRDLLAPLVAALLVSLSVANAFAAEPDLSRSRTSDEGAFVVSIESRIEPVPLNTLHAWMVSLASADGTPVEGATFEVDGGMPMHDHGLPTAPRVTEELGGGSYLLEGVRFQMPGHWVVNLDITAAGVQDSVTFELML